MHSIPSSSSATLASFPLQFGLEHERRRLTWPPARRCSSSPPACGCTSKATRVTGVAVGYEVLTRAPVQLAMDASTCARVHGQLPRRARNLVPADGPAVGWPFSCPVKPALAAAARYDTSWRPYGCLPRPERARAVLEGSSDGVPRILGRRARRCAPPRSRGATDLGLRPPPRQGTGGASSSRSGFACMTRTTRSSLDLGHARPILERAFHQPPAPFFFLLSLSST